MVADACAGIIFPVTTPVGTTIMSTAAAVEACYSSFKVSQNDIQAQVAALKSYMNFVSVAIFAFEHHSDVEQYPYTDIIKGSSAPYYPMQMDLFKELDAITTNAAIKTEVQLQSSIAEVLHKLHDGHVSYSPKCFQSFYFYQPYSLLPKYNVEGVPEIYVGALFRAPTHGSYVTWNKTFTDAGIVPTDLLGAKVKSLNGEDPVDFMQKWTDKDSGVAQAPEARFNSLLSGYNYPYLNGISYFPFSGSITPQKPITYEFQLANSTTVKKITFDWPGRLLTNPDHFESAATYYASECVPPPPPAPAAAALTGKRYMDPITGPKLFLDETASASTVEEAGLNVVAQDQNGAFILHADNTTGIWMLSTFMPDISQVTTDEEFFKVLNDWFTTVATGLTALEKAGATRLIIDVTNNGGGLVCSGFRFADYLFPNEHIKLNEYQVRMTQPLADAVTSPIIIDPFNNTAGDYLAGGLDLSGKKITDYLNQLVLPGAKLPGYPHLYSNRMYLDPNGCPPMPASPLAGNWKAKDVLIASNGLCGSTCAQFTTLLRDQVGVRAVTYGGGKKRSAGTKPFDPTAFAAGDVLKFSFLYDTFSALPPSEFTNHKTVLTAQDPEDHVLPLPFKFPIAAGSQMPFMTATSAKPKVANSLPIEYYIDQAEFHLYDIDVSDATTVWASIINGKLFETPIQSKTATTSASATAQATETISYVSGRPVEGYVPPKQLYSGVSSVSVGTMVALLSLLALL
ncbi:UNVERIFIED_CONTAM: hypothetical protein HDU68_003487 [Siphonaria sp. JEL0065]|nr:hypothetical protein HDU68_003487 [Siphonaria sp. JEL0065]